MMIQMACRFAVLMVVEGELIVGSFRCVSEPHFIKRLLEMSGKSVVVIAFGVFRA